MGKGGSFKVIIWRGTGTKGGPFLWRGVDPSRHYGMGLNIYVDYFDVLPKQIFNRYIQ